MSEKSNKPKDNLNNTKPEPKEENKIFHKAEFGYAIYKAFRRLTQAVLVIIIFCIIATAALWLRLQAGPINLDFAQDKIQQKINEQIIGYSIEFDQLNLIWPNIKRPLLIETKDLIIHQGAKEITGIKNLQIGLSPLGFLKGNVHPTFIKLTNPEIVLLQNNEGVSICCDAVDQSSQKKEKIFVTKEPITIQYIRKNLQKNLDGILNNTLTGDLKAFQSLNNIELENVIVFLEKKDLARKKIGTFDFSLKEQKDSILLSLDGFIEENNIKQSINSLIVYRAIQKDLTATSTVENINSDFWNQFLSNDNILQNYSYNLSGDVQVAFDEQFKLALAKIDGLASNGKAIFQTKNPYEITLTDAKIKAYYNRQKEILHIEKFDSVIGNIPVQMQAKGTIQKGKILLPVNITIAETQMQNINDAIPNSISKNGGLSWPKHKLLNGNIKDLSTSFQIDFIRNPETKKREINIDNLSANFLFDDMKIIYSDTLPAVTQATGSAVIQDDVLVVTATSAKIGDILSNNVVFKLDDLSVKKSGLATLDINAKAPLKSVFAYLENDPLAIKDIGFDTKKSQGSTTTQINITFPTTGSIKEKDFDVKVKATLNDVLIPNIVQNLPLSGGPFLLDYANQKLTLQGNGELASRPIAIDWKQDIKNNDIVLNASINADEGFRKAFGVHLEKYINGIVPLKIIYKDSKNIQTFDLTGDLGYAAINIDEVNYQKPKDVEGKLSLKGLLENGSLKEIDSFSINTKDLAFNNGRILFKKDNKKEAQIYRGSLKNINLNGSKLSAEFEVTPSDAIKLIIQGGFIDATPYFSTEKSAKLNVRENISRPLQLSVIADSMLFKNEVRAQKVKIYYETDKIGKVRQAEMDATIGNENVILRFKPDISSGAKVIFLEADNAGEFLRAMGIYTNVSKGKLNIKGKANNQDGKIILGKARIDDFKVKDAPILAKLINTLSLPGILGLLSNEGLTFSRMESDFEWRFRNQGDLIIVKEGRSSGASLGLTFEGVINRETNSMDVSGNIVPMSEINNLISDIPVIGDILTGGDAFLAATYTIIGPSSDPKVTVNPLAALAPGFLRKILFEEDVKEKIKKAE